MKKFKKLIGLFVASCLVIGMLTGCGSKTGGSGSAKILFINTDTNDTFRATLSEAIVNAGSSAGVQLDVVETGNDANAQLEQVQGAKDKGYDAIILRLADGETALQMNVASNGVPIVYVNAQPDGSVLEKNKFVYVGSNEEQAGEYQAEYVYEKLGKPSTMNAIILEGEPGHSGTIGRTSAVKNYFKDQGVDVNYVFVDYCNWTAEEAQQKLEIFYQTGQNFDAVFCNNDTMAIGACASLIAHGFDLASIPVCGVDATQDGCASIAAGQMQFTVLQDAQGQAAAAVEACQAIVNGGSVSKLENGTEDGKYIWVPFQRVDASNVSSFQ